MLPDLLKQLDSHTWQDEYNIGSEWVAVDSLETAAPVIGYAGGTTPGVSSP